MMLCPKIDQNLGGLDSLLRYINTKLEIQLLDDNLSSIFESINTILDKCTHLEEIIIHMGGAYLDIDDVLNLSRKEYEYMHKLIATLTKISECSGVSFSLLFHCGWSKHRVPSHKLVLNSIVGCRTTLALKIVNK